MRIIGLSDVHLGKSQFSRMTGGRNARQVDIEQAWFRAVDVIVDEDPHVVLIAGDVFDSVRPSLHAVKCYREGVRRIAASGAYVVVIPGNHEAGKTAETLSPVVIPDDIPGVHVMTSAGWLTIDAGSGERAAVLCVPHDNLGAAATFDPADAPQADVRALLIHAAVRTSAVDDALPRFYAGELAVDAGMLAEQFDVVVAGDFHEYRRLHPTRMAFYPGALEATSSNFWPELGPRGVVLCDTTTGEMRQCPIYTRPVFNYDMDDVIGYGMVPEEAGRVNHALEQIAGVAEHRDAIVRLVVDDLPRDEYPLIDRKLTAELRQLAFHFQLDVRFQERELTSTARAGSSLDEEAVRFFAQDPESVRDMALSYLRGRAA